jgi:lactate dehydrogenase-like 2-hydroxyacid dehydrogenase
MAQPHALIVTPVGKYIRDRVAAEFETHILYKAADKDALIADVGDKIEAICFGGHGMMIDDAFMSRFPNLKIISNFGVGYDNVDAKSAAARGVIVSNTPDVLTEEVADTALGLLIMTVRELSQAENWLRAGKWASEGDYRLTPATLRDRSVGIVGLGRIGKAIAKRCEAFGLPISYFARSKKDDVSYPFHTDVKSLASAVDTMILVTPATPETAGMINKDVLDALGPRGILINIARGAVVDEPALIQALRDRTIFAAGLDVMLNEPKINSELMELDNAVLLPHVGSASVHTREAMGQLVVDNMVAYKNRQTPPTPVPETPFKGW